MTVPSITLDRPRLTLDLGAPRRVLSWAVHRSGFVTAQRIHWREVRNADLPRGFDAHAWLAQELAARDEETSVAFLTSRDVRSCQTATVSVDGVTAQAVATTWLSNAERVGIRQNEKGQRFGTINIAVSIDACLNDTALTEALSIAVQARTVAVLDARITVGDRHATGTGTDCVAVASCEGPVRCAGLHTAVGEAIGRAVYTAVSNWADAWKAEQEAKADA